jgi:hypothetical protein
MIYLFIRHQSKLWIKEHPQILKKFFSEIWKTFPDRGLRVMDREGKGIEDLPHSIKDLPHLEEQCV